MADTKGCKTARWSESHQSQSKFGSQSATRLREGGVASNRGSACRGEYVPGPCTHRPSHHESRPYLKVRLDHLLSREQVSVATRDRSKSTQLGGLSKARRPGFSL